jgi:ATP-dependent DNA helicase RecG
MSERVVHLNRDNALALCERQESDFFDHKNAKIDGRGVQKIAVAFANADGGEFVLGIADESDEAITELRWQGLAQLEDFNHHLQALFNLTPTIEFRYEFLTAQGLPGTVLRIYIEKSAEVARVGDGKVYLRVGAQSLVLSDPDKITALSFAKGAKSFESVLLPDLLPEEIVDSLLLPR